IEAVYAVTDGIVIVDEAYHEFAPHDAPSAVTLLAGRPRLVVSRTMSKASPSPAPASATSPRIRR
ncbi:aminotransferase class I/II-fold pyridoxal phosphate-dependent enzyme, partial [Escherichia coli]|uniref:aminotransferase class I/II-fold pyridoxal phosphate-dependent enzyme n=1 Tax=Escherichia coli TaxID=562 RepID=UPI003CE4ED25